VARVFQDPLAGTCAELTVEENLALAAARGQRRGLRPALDRALRAECREHLARLGLGLEHRLEDRMNLLSGGSSPDQQAQFGFRSLFIFEKMTMPCNRPLPTRPI
jgi:ABC-type uncharacterized transport system ATPase component